MTGAQVEACRIGAVAATRKHPRKKWPGAKAARPKEGHNLQRGTPSGEMGGKHRTGFSLLDRFLSGYDE
jgi:hypothetical protein